MRHVWALVLVVLLIGNPLHTAGAKKVSIEPMSAGRFWAIVDATTHHAADPDEQLENLQSQLSGLSQEEIAAFDFALHNREMRRAYTWDLWGAAYIIQGGASDDGFDYFRYWLISRGRAVFEAALRNPDDLADMIPPDFTDEVEFVDFPYAARMVWHQKNRSGLFGWLPPYKKYPTEDLYVGSLEPSGERFEEDPDYLARRFPRLWTRFGNNPLPRN